MPEKKKSFYSFSEFRVQEFYPETLLAKFRDPCAEINFLKCSVERRVTKWPGFPEFIGIRRGDFFPPGGGV